MSYFFFPGKGEANFVIVDQPSSQPVFRIQIRKVLGLPDPIVRGTDPDSNPYSPLIKQ